MVRTQDVSIQNFSADIEKLEAIIETKQEARKKVTRTLPTRSSRGTTPPIGFIGETPVLQNIALGKPATQLIPREYLYDDIADKAVNGNRSHIFSDGGMSYTRIVKDPWWKVDLQGVYDIDQIKVYRRDEEGNQDTLNGFEAQILLNDKVVWSMKPFKGRQPPRITTLDVFTEIYGDAVMISIPGKTLSLQLAEVEVFG